MDTNSEKARLDLIKKRFKRINIINTLVISVLLCCYAIVFVIYQAIQTSKLEDVINSHVSSVYDSKSLFIYTLFDCLDNKNVHPNTSGDFSYSQNSAVLRFNKNMFLYALSNHNEQKLVTVALIASWEDNYIIPSEVYAVIESFIKTCENSRNVGIISNIISSLGLADRTPTGKYRYLVVSDTTRYELTYRDKPPYQLVLLASPRGSMGHVNFAN